MIKLPEPVSLLHCHTAQNDCHYTESQLKQAVRDAYEDAAKLFNQPYQEYCGQEAQDSIRALIKGIDA